MPAKKSIAKSTESPAKADTLTTVPEWANTDAIGELIGLTPRRVQELTREGKLYAETPGGTKRRKYKIRKTIQDYIAYKISSVKPSNDREKMAELELKKLEAEVELKESQGQLHRLKTAIAEGKYIAAEEAGQELADFMRTFRRFVSAMPARLLRTVPEQLDAVTIRAMEKSMRDELDSMLDAFTKAAHISDMEKNE